MPPDGSQQLFAQALLQGAPPPSALRLAGSGEDLERRFSVYRNTVFAALTGALEAKFAGVAALVGADFFRGMATQFAAEHPPVSPVLLEYGEGFPGFIASFAPAKDIPYLADVTRLEWAMHAALQAADAEPAALSALQTIDPEGLDSVTFIPHPAARLIASDYPVAAILRAATGSDGGDIELSGPDYVLVTRPGFTVQTHALAPEDFAFVKSLFDGAPLSAAFEAAAQVNTAFDVAAALALVFSAGAIRAVNSTPERL